METVQSRSSVISKHCGIRKRILFISPEGTDAAFFTKTNKNLEDIELEGFRVAENTAVKDEKKTVTLTVVECSEFHNMGEFHENIKSVEEAIAIFKEIPLERMHGIPAIGIRVADPNNLDDGVEMDVLIGKRIDLDILHYVPEIADNWQAQQMIR